MRAKKLFPELTFKRLWNKITGVEKRVTTNESAISELNKKIEGSTTDNASPIYLTNIAVTWCMFNGFAIVDVAFGVGGTFDSSDGEVNINNVPITPKPTKNYYAPACSENGKNTNNCTVRLDTDGNLKAIGKFTESSTTYYASFMFKVA